MINLRHVCIRWHVNTTMAIRMPLSLMLCDFSFYSPFEKTVAVWHSSSMKFAPRFRLLAV